MKPNSYYQLLPQKVVEALPVISKLLETEITGFSVDNLKEVISIVCRHIRSKSQEEDDGAAPLRIDYIKKLVPQGDRYLAGLVFLGVIDRVGNYKPGVKAYKYRFSDGYQSRYIRIALKNAKLQRRIESALNAIQKRDRKILRNHSEQIKFLKSLSINPNYKVFIDNHYKTDTDEYNHRLASAQRIENGDIFYSVDQTSFRFHSNITSLSKDLRPYLRIKGKQLINIDIKNSQPFLSTIILTNPGKVSNLTENSAFSVLLQSLEIPQNQDVKKYIFLVDSGQLYEYMMGEFAKEDLYLTRNETKKQVLRILYARNKSPKNPINKKCRQIFKSRFPTVHRIFCKVRGSEKGDKFHNHKRFAILMQRIESHLILDIILKRIKRELPGTIAVTIHDSIMTGRNSETTKAIIKIIEEEVYDNVGLKPKIKIEGNEEEERRRVIYINQYDATICVNAS